MININSIIFNYNLFIFRKKGLQLAKKINSASIITAAGNKPKKIEEFIGRVNSNTSSISVARMKSPSGWIEPAQKPEFDEYTLVLKGKLNVKTENDNFEINENEAVIISKNEWVQYSTPGPEGAEYIAICIPAFSQYKVHREDLKFPSKATVRR